MFIAWGLNVYIQFSYILNFELKKSPSNFVNCSVFATIIEYDN